VSTGLPDTSTLDDGEKYKLYEQYIQTEEYSAAVDALGDGQRVILGLRVPTSLEANDGGGLYDDRFVVLWKDDSAGHAEEFLGNTEPSGYYEGTVGEDVDGDGRLDLGRIPQGIHYFHKGTSQKFGRVLRPVNGVRVERDANHDGNFSEADLSASDNPEALLRKDFLFYAGLPDRTGSAGGQTLHPDAFDGFWEALGDQQEFHYVLVQV
jgi:hypothetical protein